MDTQATYRIEETADGFLAYQLQNPSCYAYGATEEEAREALYDLAHESSELYIWEEWN